jgi:hypothetical protein
MVGPKLPAVDKLLAKEKELEDQKRCGGRKESRNAFEGLRRRSGTCSFRLHR